MRKFGNLWRSLTWNNLLRRNADSRRQQFSEAIKANEAKKRKRDEELKDILAAVEESKAVKRLMQHQKEIADEVEKLKAERRKEYEATHGPQKVAGQKRKSLSDYDDLRDDGESTNAGPATPGHKRSRTLDPSSDPSSSPEQWAEHISGRFPTVWPRYPPGSTQEERSSQKERLRKQQLARKQLLLQMEQSAIRRDSRHATFYPGPYDRPKVDKTVTDYFKLKALGLDPDTPLIPLTEKQLDAKKAREAEEKKRTLERIKKRHYHGGRFKRLRSPSPPLFPETSPPASPLLLPAEEAVAATTANASTWNEDEDDLLKQARAQRKELDEGSNWLVDPSLEVEQQIEEEVERRVKQELNAHSSHSSVTTSPNGLARVNGYQYLPAPTKAGIPLSRSEQRIRATGAHGLAFKPLRLHPDYVPVGVAMSKRSASKYSSELNSQQVSSPLGKRPLLDHDDDEIDDTTSLNPLSTPQKKSSKKPPADASHDEGPVYCFKPSPPIRDPPFRPQIYSDDESGIEEDYEDVEEESAEETDEEGEPRGEYGDGEYEDLEDEDEEDEDDMESEEEDEDLFDGGDQNYGHSGYTLPHEELVDAMTPSTNAQASRAASSVPGASADDALVLSDSD